MRLHDVTGLAGPWKLTQKNVVSCGSDVRRDMTLTISAVRDRRKRVIGNRLLVALGSDTLVRAIVTRRGGGVWISPDTCGRS